MVLVAMYDKEADVCLISIFFPVFVFFCWPLTVASEL